MLKLALGVGPPHRVQVPVHDIDEGRGALQILQVDVPAVQEMWALLSQICIEKFKSNC